MAKETKPTIADWSECDRVLGKVRRCDARAAVLEARREAEKAKIDEAYRGDLDGLSFTRKAAVASIRTFCSRRRKADFGDAKSRQLDNGVVGWRLGNHRCELLNGKLTVKDVLIKLCRAGKKLAKRYTRVVIDLWKQHVIDDYKAGKVTDADLADVGLRVTQTERFFIDPKLDEGRDRNAES